MGFFGRGLGLPVIQRTVRPSIAGTPVWYAEASTARTQLDINITIPSGTARKLIVLWGTNADPGTITVTFEPAGVVFPMIAIPGTANSQGVLRCAGFYLDTPPEGAKVVRIATTNAVRSVASLKVIQNARAGLPEPFSQATNDTTLTETLAAPLLDAYSITCDLVLALGLADGQLTPLAGQTPGADDVVNSAFLATTSDRTHSHSGDVDTGWTAASATDLLWIGVNVPFSSGQVAVSGFTALSRWLFDTQDATEFPDADGRSPALRTGGAAASVVNPLLNDGGRSLSIQGAIIAAPHHVDYLTAASWSVEIYFQLRALPTTSNNKPLFGKDTGLPVPGGIHLEVYNDAGTARLRAYIRDGTGGTGTAIWVEASATSTHAYGTIALNTAYAAWLTFDNATKTAKLWYRPAGGAVTLLASKTDTNFAGLTSNTAGISICCKSNTAGLEQDGIVDSVRFGSGVLTQAEIEARPPPLTISDVPPTGITVSNISLGTLAPSTNTDFDPVIAGSATGVGAGTRTLAEVADTANRMSFLSNPGATPLGRIATPTAPSSPVNESAQATLNESGRTSNVFTVSWTRQAASGGGGYTPFAFKTNLSPSSYNHTGVSSKPSFNASDPYAARITDPMSGLKIWRLSPNRGTEIKRNGTISTGLFQPRALRNPNSPTQEAWNRDTTLLLLDSGLPRSDDPSNSCRSVLIDVDGNQGSGGPWRVLRADAEKGFGDLTGRDGDNNAIVAAVRFWDWQDPPHGNPDRMFCISNFNGQVREWFPKTGAINLLPWPAYPSGFKLPGPDTYWVFASGNGRYYAQAARRTSDGRWGAFRRDLRTGDLEDFVPSDNTNDTANASPSGISQNGQFTAFAVGGHEFWFRDLVTGQAHGKTPDEESSHSAWCDVNGRQYLMGAHSNTGFRLWDIVAQSRVQLISNANLAAVNSHHTGGQNVLDRFETYGGTGSGASSGLRYAIFGRANAANMELICGIRLGPSDIGKTPPVGRVICCHRSRKTFHQDNNNEAHNQPSRDMRYVVFASNWAMAGCSGDETQSQAYVVEIPDAWKSPNNDGS